MTLGLRVGDETFVVGEPDVLHAFFSTISHHLEPNGWGSRFPAFMNEMYQGELPAERGEAALMELTTARRELSELPATDVVWDIDDPVTGVPDGQRPADGVANLSRYFVAEDGRSLFDVLALALIRQRMAGGATLCIVDVESVAASA